MVEFMVLGKTTTGEIKGLGSYHFAAPPRTGEYITLDDENNVGQAYLVKAVIHPLVPTVTAGDLVVEHVGTEIDLLKSL